MQRPTVIIRNAQQRVFIYGPQRSINEARFGRVFCLSPKVAFWAQPNAFYCQLFHLCAFWASKSPNKRTLSQSKNLKLIIEQCPTAHVLIFPFPALGHVNSMLKLAKLLGLASIQVTFLNTDFIHERLVRYTDIETRFSCYPGLQFKTVSDGLSADHPRALDKFIEVYDSLNLKTAL